MLVDGQGHAYGWLESLEIFTTVIDALPWQGEVWSRFSSLSTAQSGSSGNALDSVECPKN
jgi:hypothetical protein